MYNYGIKDVDCNFSRHRLPFITEVNMNTDIVYFNAKVIGEL